MKMGIREPTDILLGFKSFKSLGPKNECTSQIFKKRGKNQVYISIYLFPFYSCFHFHHETNYIERKHLAKHFFILNCSSANIGLNVCLPK